MFLNNRYKDPTTGIFLSVDPLVATTGEPYLYAAGDPTTYSDPSGLEPCSWCSSAQSMAISGELPTHGALGREGSGGSAHERLVWQLSATYQAKLDEAAAYVEQFRNQPYTYGHMAYFGDKFPGQAIADMATQALVDQISVDIAGLTEIGNGIFLLPEGSYEGPSRHGNFPTEILGDSGWKASLVDDNSPARHLIGWLALAFNYNKGQAIAGLRVAEGNAKVQGSSQQDYDLGLIGIEVGNQLGSTGYSGWSAIGQLNAATGDSGQAQFNARPEPPSAVPGGGQRNYACYFGAFWC